MSSRSLYQTTLWNLAGNVLPLAVGLYAIPRLIAGMGDDRFGALTLIWSLIGYFGIFDLGLGRAITQAVAETLGSKQKERAAVIFQTGMVALTLVGFVGAVVFYVAGRPLLMHFIKMDAGLREEFGRSLIWIALTIPFLTLTSAYKGLLEAYGRFGVLNLLRVPYGILTFALPLCFPSSLRDLSAVAAQLSLLRAALAVAQWLATRPLRCAAPRPRVEREILRRLVRFGGWMTVSNVISPLMTSVDRFVIAALASVSVVAYYTTPFEVVMRLLVIPGALSTTLFPWLGQRLVDDLDAASRVYRNSTYALALVLFPTCLAVTSLGYEAMAIWLGHAFADEARWVLVLLTIGVLCNGLAYLPYTLLQSAGRSRATSLNHVLEVLLYVPALALLVLRFGIAGAAGAWALRAWGDLLLLERQASRVLAIRRSVALFALPLSAALAAGGWIRPLWASALVLAIVGIISASMLFKSFRAPHEATMTVEIGR